MIRKISYVHMIVIVSPRKNVWARVLRDTWKPRERKCFVATSRCIFVKVISIVACELLWSVSHNEQRANTEAFLHLSSAMSLANFSCSHFYCVCRGNFRSLMWVLVKYAENIFDGGFIVSWKLWNSLSNLWELHNILWISTLKACVKNPETTTTKIYLIKFQVTTITEKI